MKTSQVALYALRLAYSQPTTRERAVPRSAVALATVGIGLSTFSIKQMVQTQTRRF